MTEISLTAANALVTSIFLATVEHADIQRKWAAISSSRASKQLMLNQADALTDILLRSLEGRTRAILDSPSHDADLGLSMQEALSRYWIFSWYGIIRVLQKQDSTLTPILKKLELVRIPLAKFEIAKDYKIKQAVEFRRSEASDALVYLYSGQNKLEYIPARFIDRTTGSLGWRVYDTGSSTDVLIYRREISDDLLTALTLASAP